MTRPAFPSAPTTAQTSESGGTATFTIALTSRPTADVTVALTSSDTSEGTVLPASVTFTPANWNAPRQITVTGQDDAEADGNVAYTIVTAPAVSADTGYQGRNPADVSLTNLNNDTAGVTVQPTVGQTTEAGGSAVFTIVLDSRPTADVTIGLTSSNLSEGILSLSSVTFTPANWNTARQIIITGQDDAGVDGNVAYTIVTARAVSADPNYHNLNAADMSLTNLDNDTAGILVDASGALETSEAGTTAQFAIRLTSQPSASVVINLSSSDTSEGIVSPSSLTFTAANWNTPQTVRVHGADDFQADGDVAYRIITAPATTSDPNYNGRDADDPLVTNRDDDEAGLLIGAVTPLTTSELGQTASFSVALLSQPAAAVTVNIGSSDSSEAQLRP